MAERSCALGKFRCTTALGVIGHPNIMEAGAEIFKDLADLRGKRNLKR
jgi:hypothetical protein